MTRIRFLASSLTLLGGVLFVYGCNIDALTQPCYGTQHYDETRDYGQTGWKTANGIDGSWHLVSVDGRPLPYQVPFSSFNPGGVIVAKGAGLQLDTELRSWNDDCSALRGERGIATASYRYSAGGVDKPKGIASGTFDADHETNTAILGAAGKTQTVTLTRDASGRVIRITAANIAVKKWGAELTFTLVFERGTDFGVLNVSPP